MTARSAFGFVSGTVGLCVQNSFLTQNTRVFTRDIAQGGLDAISRCCDLSQPTCALSRVTIFGDSGLSLIVEIGPEQGGALDCPGGIEGICLITEEERVSDASGNQAAHDQLVPFLATLPQTDTLV